MLRWVTWAVVALATLSCEREILSEEPPDGGRVTPPRAPDCLALPETMDFGEVEVGSRGDFQFSLTNNTIKTIDVSVGPVNPPFFVSVEGVLRVESGRSVPLRVSFVPSDGRLNLGVLDYSGGAGCKEQRIELRGMGAGQLIVPPVLDLGPIPIGVASPGRVTVVNTRRAAVRVSVVAFGPVASSTTSFEVPALGAANLMVTMTPEFPGHLEGTLQLTSDRNDRVLVNVAAQGGVPRAELSRSAVRLERLPMSNNPLTMPLIQRTVALSNTGDGELFIESLAVRGGNGSGDDEIHPIIVANPIPARGVSQVFLQFLPERVLGPRSWVLHLFTNEPGRRELELPISAEVVSLPDCASISVSDLLISIPPGSLPAAPEVTITNAGAEACLLDDLRLSPELWAMTPPQDQVLLAPGAAHTVSFSVLDAGTATFVANPIGAGVGYLNVRVRAQ